MIALLKEEVKDMSPKVSVCIACYKQEKFLQEAFDSINMQTFRDLETQFFIDNEGIGSGEAFNKAISKANGEIIILLCADDVFTDKNVISDIVACFENPSIAHVSRWYHQFVDGNRHPVRAWRSENVIELANNPSGLAFRSCIMPRLTNKMFVEAPEAVSRIISCKLTGLPYGYQILRYDTIAVRVHKSIARSPDYYKKMWVSSPALEWSKLGWKTDDFTSLVQIKNYYTTKAVIQEINNFFRINPLYIFNPCFIFYSIVAVCVPRIILFKLPEIYRATFGRWMTREVKRCG